MLLHREILGLKPGDPWVDHLNGDRLDNRRENLRLATPSQNGLNRARPGRANRSGFIGVRKHSAGRWSAQVQVERKQHYLGLFDTPEEAAAAVAAFRVEKGLTI